MRRLVVNGSERPLENLPENWGNLLERVEQEAAGRAEVVTAVRFNDVDQPAFRHAALSRCLLSEVESIEVETASKRGLVDEALAQGVMSADTLGVAANEASQMFRRGDLAPANQRLVEFADGIRSLVVLVGAVSAACGGSVDQVEVNGRTVSDEVNDLIGRLEDVVKAQHAYDWLTVADILEYEFQPTLANWQSLFDRLRSAIPA